MFYDLENPNKFIKDSALALGNNGIFIAQLMCLKSMIEKNDLGNICHEHIEFYSLKSIKFLLSHSDALKAVKDQNKLKSKYFSIEKNMQKT